MQFIDMHCDSLMRLFFEDRENANLYDSKKVSVDFVRMKKGQQLAQFFGVFVPPQAGYQKLGVEPVSDEEYITTCRNYLLDNVAKHEDIIRMAYSGQDIEKNSAEGRMSAVLTMEDGKAVDGKLENLKRYYEMGFRAITLTWNFSNCFGTPCSKEAAVMKEGLTDFGKEAVSYMQELGIIVDVSHLSEGGFYDVADICKRPFVATHSNCIALGPHPRNLTDAQIRVLGCLGGVTGINFSPEFLNEDIESNESTVERMAKHARHIADVGGVECVGLGSDLDGIRGNLEISDCSKVQLLVDGLKKEGFMESEIEKIFYTNVLRVMKDCIK